ncbi:bacteriophage lambda minor tail family protein [Escherichia coli 179550]|nr:bacteriophage lambda minor tail family protein [Escherichia coli 179550]
MNEAVKQIEQEVLTTWPTEAISHAENVVCVCPVCLSLL